MHVSVLLVSFRNVDDVLRCLDALTRSTHTDFELVICENGGLAAFDAMHAALPARLPGGQPIRLIAAPDNPGFAGGVNAGLLASREAAAWWLLNPDTAPQPGALAALVARLARGDVLAVGGVLYGEDGRVQSYAGAWSPLLCRAESIGHGSPLAASPDPAEVEARMSYIVGASMLVSAGFVAAVGPMREDYFLYGEELEWCLRAGARGIRLGFAPDALVLHYHGTTTGASVDRRQRSWTFVYLNERNKLLLVRDADAGLMPIAAPLSLALMTLHYLRRGAWRQFGYGVSGWLAGCLGRRGKPARLREQAS